MVRGCFHTRNRTMCQKSMMGLQQPKLKPCSKNFLKPKENELQIQFGKNIPAGGIQRLILAHILPTQMTVSNSIDNSDARLPALSKLDRLHQNRFNHVYTGQAIGQYFARLL